jgi:hypothetical protein
LGHALVPRNGVALPVAEVAKRLQQAFPYVDIDFDAGRRAAAAQADRIEKMPAAMLLGQRARAVEYARELRTIAPDGAAVIVFGQAPDRALKVTVLPGEMIKFGYQSSEEEAQNRELVARCASALDCDLAEF